MAGLVEIVWAFAMKQSHGFTRLWPSLVTAGAMALSVGLLAWSMRSLPLGTAYPVWTGIGAVGPFVVGIAVPGQPANAPPLLDALLIVSGPRLTDVESPG